ncbi:Beta-galactoside alpha-2,6-sialyltransferase 2 [Pteropus alecto]|uniref:Beta-galactoside alpha-2,6-sialyltransferase 2 n=1 Tax=Pteropus alecto TaxID=9402 RepID=L5K132_PTEAL|nr:Beta-galactoside alpha-2,6-sialyltransferase 2 [Pteropus alecto]
MGAMQEPSLPGSVDANKGLLDGRPSGPFLMGPRDLQRWDQVQDRFENEELFSPQARKKSQSAFHPGDDDYFFAAGQPGSRTHTQGTSRSLFPGDVDWREGVSPALEAHRGPVKKRHRQQGRRHVLDEGDDGDRLYSSMSRAFLHRLWKGNVSSKMLNPRLQKAMKDYLSANKHGLHPRGLRSCAVVMSAGAILNSSLGEEIGECHRGDSGRSPKLGASFEVGDVSTCLWTALIGHTRDPALDVPAISRRVLFPLLGQNEPVGDPGGGLLWRNFRTEVFSP